MKEKLTLVLLSAMAAALLAGCGAGNAGSSAAQSTAGPVSSAAVSAGAVSAAPAASQTAGDETAQAASGPEEEKTDAAESAAPAASGTGGSSADASLVTPAEITKSWSVRGDYSAITREALQGTWKDPNSGETLRFDGETCFCDLPWMGEDNDPAVGCSWTITDRSAAGCCPRLDIQIGETDVAYYVSGVSGGCFWCNTQQQIFYKQA
jgi:hypothetical protein